MSGSAATPTGAPSSGPAGRMKRREPLWDNARLACIVLVVLGHAVQRLTYDSDIALGLYLLVYTFHMPAFAIISGYFSKSDSPSRTQMARVLTDIVAPYVIFEALWTLTKWLVEGRANPNLTQPSWTLWFLLALGIFRLVLPYLALLKWPLLWTVVISLTVGYLPNIDSTLSLDRTLGLLPFFTLGWWLAHHRIVHRFDLLRRRRWWVRAIAIGMFGIVGFFAWFLADAWREMNLREWLQYDETYADLGGTEWWAGGVRLVLLAIGARRRPGPLSGPGLRGSFKPYSAGSRESFSARRCLRRSRCPAASTRTGRAGPCRRTRSGGRRPSRAAPGTPAHRHPGRR